MPRVSQTDVIKRLVENNIVLQDKTTQLISEMSQLTKRVDNMVGIFEEAAKNIKSGADEPLLRKLEALLDQNKNIARGLILLERYVREKPAVEDFPPRPLPRTEF